MKASINVLVAQQRYNPSPAVRERGKPPAARAVGRGALLLAVAVTLAACSLGPKRAEPQARPEAPAEAAVKGPDKGDPQARFDAALEQLKAKQLQEAEQGFLTLTQDFPQYSGPWTNLGILYANSKRRPQAMVAFNKAAVLNQENVVAFDWIGILARETRDYPRAQAAYERVLKLQPDHALAHYNLAILLDEYLKRPADALPHYREYQRLSGKQDLKVLAWVAEIEAQASKASATPAAPPPSTPAAPSRAPGRAPASASARPAESLR